jgi:hypothetical protein
MTWNQGGVVHEADLLLQSFLSLLSSRTNDTIDRADGRNIIFVAHTFLE